MTTDSTREAAERWLAERMNDISGICSVSAVNPCPQCLERFARIAADFAERLAKAACNEKLLTEIFGEKERQAATESGEWLLPWAEAMKDAGEEPGK
jgi:hypothetical protein